MINLKKALSLATVMSLLASMLIVMPLISSAEDITTTDGNEWKVTAPDGVTAPIVSGNVNDGYNVTFTNEGSMAKFNYGFEDITSQTLVLAPTLTKDFLNSKTSGNFTSVISFSTNPDAAMLPVGQTDVIQVRPTFVASSLIVHRIVRLPSGTSSTLGTYSRGYFGYDKNYQQPNGDGAILTFVQSEGVDTQMHWYLQIQVPLVGKWLVKGTTESDDAHLRFDRFVGQPVYISFGCDTTGQPLSYYFKSTTASQAATTNATAIGTADAAIEALPDINMLTSADEDAVNAAADLVADLEQNSAFIKKANITKITYLQDAMPEVKIQAAVSNVEAAIDAIPVTADELTNENYANYKNTIASANAAYNALGDNTSNVDTDKVTKLMTLVTKLAELDSAYQQNAAAAEAFEATVTALGTPTGITIANYVQKKTVVESIRANYIALDEAVSAMVSPASISAMQAMETRLLQVKNAVDVDTDILALPEVSALQLSDKTAVDDTRVAYEALGVDKALITEATLTILTNVEARVIELQIATGDWYVTDDVIQYTGSEKDGWRFDDVRNQGSNLYATTTKDYDMTQNTVTWAKSTSGNSSYFSLALTTDVLSGYLPGKTDTNGVIFVLRPTGGNKLRVSCWSPNETSPEAMIKSSDPTSMEDGYYTNFDGAANHTFAFVKNDGHWYLKIDEHVFIGRSFDQLDAYMEANATATKVRIGGAAGFRAELLQIGNQIQSGDWWYSVVMGSDSQGNVENGWTLNIPQGAYAQYQNAITNLEDKPISVNFNTAEFNSAPELGFVASKDAERLPAKGQGVVIRLYNRPATDPGNTHVLAWVNGTWITVFAVPAVGNTNAQISVMQDVDGHYYLYVAGKQVAFGAGSANEALNEYLWMDNMVGENEAYLRVASRTANALTASVSFVTADNGNEEEVVSDTDVFLSLLDGYFDSASQGNKESLTILTNAWNALNYITQMDVEARLMDSDESAYDLLQNIKSYTVNDTDINDEGNSPVDTGVPFPSALIMVAVISTGVLYVTKRKKVL